MTYCLALRLHEGLVFLADTRTNAGVDNVGTYRKLHVLRAGAGPRVRPGVRRQPRHHPGGAGPDRGGISSVPRGRTWRRCTHLFEAALYIGRLNREVASEHGAALASSGADGTATFILGGQILPGAPDILLVYPEGNYIRASDERPFLQIGESKYGKFMLELAVEAHVDIDTATKIALGSMMSTARANLSVGPPYDAAVYLDGSAHVDEFRIESDAPLLDELRAVWEQHMLGAIADLPRISFGVDVKQEDVE